MTDGSTDDEEAPLPEALVETAVTLTRRARQTDHDQAAAAYREDRDRRLADHDYRARVREERERSVLVLHPDEWVDDGVADPTAIDDLDRAVERPLDGPGEASDWDAVEAHNRDLVATVADRDAAIHGANAAAFADFMANHYARRMDTASDDEVCEFLEEYYPRNAWPTEAERAVVEDSLRRVFAAADRAPPPALRDDEPGE